MEILTILNIRQFGNYGNFDIFCPFCQYRPICDFKPDYEEHVEDAEGGEKLVEQGDGEPGLYSVFIFIRSKIKTEYYLLNRETVNLVFSSTFFFTSL